jgi:ParB family chromosome partitioning protein
MSSNVYHGQEMHIQYIPIDKIRPNPYQPRRVFEKEQLDELADSIKEYGVMQPINIRCINGTSYELVTGERRLRAGKIAGLETIPAIVIEITDRDSAVIALIENLQRQNLNFLEEGEGYQNLITDYGITQEDLAKKLGKSQSTIANKLRILRLSPKIKKLVLENDLSERHARALLKIPDERLQFETIEKVIKQELNVKATDQLVEEVLQKILDNNLPKEEQKVKRFIGDIRLFTNTIKQAIELMNKSGVDAMYLAEQREHVYEIKINIPM